MIGKALAFFELRAIMLYVGHGLTLRLLRRGQVGAGHFGANKSAGTTLLKISNCAEPHGLVLIGIVCEGIRHVPACEAS